MPAPVRPPGDTRQLIVEFLETTGRPMTWPEIARAVGITAGYRTQRRMLELGQIQQAGFDASGTQLYAASSQSVPQRSAVKRQTTQSQCTPSLLAAQPRQTTTELMSVPSFHVRLSQLDQPHIRALTAFRERLLETLPLHSFVPNFDPADAGVDAKLLLLLETPGRVPRKTNFTSLDNPSATSKNLKSLVAEAGLPRSELLMWNLVPWDIGLRTKVQATTGCHRSIGTPALRQLLELLPSLRVIVFFGDNAPAAIPDVHESRGDLILLRSPHPSPTVLNTRPEKRGEILAALTRATHALYDG